MRRLPASSNLAEGVWSRKATARSDHRRAFESWPRARRAKASASQLVTLLSQLPMTSDGASPNLHRSSDSLPVRVIKQSLQAITERCRETGGPGRVEKADADHVEEVNSVFESIGGQLH
jgi:hypothetical protein